MFSHFTPLILDLPVSITAFKMDVQKKGRWIKDEDNELLRLVGTYGARSWAQVAYCLRARSQKQCRERFHQYLKSTINLDPITQDEGILIKQLVLTLGKRWAEIARRLPQRTDDTVKTGGINRKSGTIVSKTNMG